MIKTPESLADILRHMANGGLVLKAGAEFRFHSERGFESRLSERHDWFPCATSMHWEPVACLLVDVGGA